MKRVILPGLLLITILAFTSFTNKVLAPVGGVRVGDKAPELVLNDPEGNPISLSSLKGKLVLVDFWASWCFPCRKENPNVVRLYHKFKDSKFTNAEGFTIYSVSLDKVRGAWIRAIEKDNLEWTNHVSDLSGWGSAAASTYGVTKIPTTFLVGSDGTIIAKDLKSHELDAKLSELVQGGE